MATSSVRGYFTGFYLIVRQNDMKMAEPVDKIEIIRNNRIAVISI